MSNTESIPSKHELRQPLEAAQYPDALLQIPTAAAFVGLSVATMYRKAAADPTFPKLIKIGARCTRIRAGDLAAWVARQAELSQSPAVPARRDSNPRPAA